MESFKVVVVSPEVVPFAKTGGLADVTGALPKALARLGNEVTVILPKYRKVDERKFNLKEEPIKLSVPLGERLEEGGVKSSRLPGMEKVKVYFIANDKYYDRDELYRTKEGDYPDNAERFIFFSRATKELIKKLGYAADIIHCHDWQTALIPAYLKTIYREDPLFKNTATVFTVHNIAYQGVFPKETLPLTGLGWDLFTMDKLEFWGNLNIIKAGLVFADILNTVSPTYSKEIQTTEEYGRGLEGALRARSNELYGVLNGIDYEEWDPAKDAYITPKYDLKRMAKKREVKRALLKENGLPYRIRVPLIGMVSRLDDQKGFDLLAAALEELMAMSLELIILGTGEEEYHQLLQGMKKRYPQRIAVHLVFDNALAHRIYGGSDMFLMPSRFEPCGLGQLISLKYGTIPIVRKTGGLADTIKDFDPETGEGNGFSFSEYSPLALVGAIKRALSVFQDAKTWSKLMANAMSADYSWEASAREYMKLYEIALKKRRI